MITGMRDNTIILYGIPNCDTVKKARQWLDGQGAAYRFHDFKRQGVPSPQLERWLQVVGWEKLLNRQGPTWRKLDDATRAGVTDAASARAVALANPSVIRRPVVEWDTQATDGVTVGFAPEPWTARLKGRPA